MGFGLFGGLGFFGSWVFFGFWVVFSGVWGLGVFRVLGFRL